MNDGSARSRAQDLFVGGGEMGAIMRATDWSRTRLGPVETWPQSLRTMLGVVLGSRFPMLLWWGPDLLHLYNDAYRPILRDKHPASLAAPAAEVWAEVWDVAGPMARSVQEGGPATWTEDLQLFINSGDMAEETFFTFSYSPVPGDDGRVGGVLNTVQETTAKVQGEREVRMLHDLAARATEARSEAETCAVAAEVLAANPMDVPFCLLYLVDEKAGTASLAGSGGLTGYCGPANAAHLPISGNGSTAGWPIAEAIRGGRDVIVDDVSARFGPPLSPPSGARPERAILIPLTRTGQAQPYGVLIAGISPHRELDDRYQGFFRAAARQVMTVIANARAYQVERNRVAALMEIDRAKTDFFSNVSHEFRTPLTLMLGPTEDALASPEQSLSGEPLRMVRRNAVRLMTLVNSLLDFSRMEAGRAQASYEPTDLAAMTSYVASAFRSAIERADLTFEVECEPLPEPIYVDPDMWEKVVLNLLSNALKFTFTGSIAASVRWRGDHAEVEVRDTGTGVPEHELPHLFRRFHRVKGAKARTHEGSGIGLALTHELVRLHGGTIRVESKEGRGTTFTISLPAGFAHLPADRITVRTSAWSAKGTTPLLEEALRWSGAEPPRATAPRTTQTAAAPKAAPDAPRVLVVDDNADLREYMVNLLSARYAVDTAVDGEAGLEAARANRPALILSDVMMPRLDGFGLLKEVRGNPDLDGVPVILLSARAGEESTVEGLEAGADDYLVKPFAARELLARVHTYIELARQRRALAHAKDLADAANQELESFSYSIAHDLRAPLRTIDGFSQILREDYAPNLDADGQGYLTRVSEAAQRMSLLIDSLLHFSRTTRSELKREPLDLSALARATIARLAAASPDRTVAVSVQDGVNDDADPRLVGVVLDNLLGNAWKFTGKRQDARVEFGVDARAGQPVYFVRDNGAGFDMAYAERLFGVFQRLHAPGDFEGTGIGLATAQRIISRHGGRIWAEGAVGKGATFFFALGGGSKA